jgi:hypothetical protein
MKHYIISPDYEKNRQIREINREVERARSQARDAALTEILALVDKYAISDDDLRAVESTMLTEMDERKMMRQIQRIPPANDGSAKLSQEDEDGAKRPQKEGPARWPEMEATQRRQFNAWRRSLSGDQSHFEAWQAALRYNKFGIDEGTSEEAFRLVYRSIKSVGDEATLTRFDIWCAAIYYGQLMDLAIKTLGSSTAAITWLYKPCVTLDRTVPIDLLWFDPPTIEDELRRLESLIRPN